MKKLLFAIILAGVLLSLTPTTASAGWYVGVGSDCYCCWGTPSPWDPWWECPEYWEVWMWCQHRPFWMWPWWARRWVSYHYSSCGRYYYTYYDYYVPGARRVYVDGIYRYRYSVQLDRSYSTHERIPRRNGFERPMPEVVQRTLAERGPEYRVRETPAEWTTPEYREVVSRRSTSPDVSTPATSRRTESSPTPSESSRRSGLNESTAPSVSNRGTTAENPAGNISDFSTRNSQTENITSKRTSDKISPPEQAPAENSERESSRTTESKSSKELKNNPPPVSRETSRSATESSSRSSSTSSRTKSAPTSESSTSSRRSR